MNEELAEKHDDAPYAGERQLLAVGKGRSEQEKMLEGIREHLRTNH